MKHNLMPLNIQFFADEETSVNNEEVADLQNTTVDETVETSEGETPEEVTEGTAETDAQSAEENARYAAARRRAEMEFNRRQAEEDAEYERRFGNYTNPITGQPIRCRRDYFEALDAQETLKRNQELQSKGLDPQMFEQTVQRMVANNPTVLQAQAVMEETRRAQASNALDEDIKAIQRMNPNVKSIDDVFADPNFLAMKAHTDRGLRLADAYKLVNFDTLLANNNASVKQAAINNIKGTSHLNTTDGVSSNDDGVDIPSAELSAWKRAFPECSMKELRKKYNATL